MARIGRFLQVWRRAVAAAIAVVGLTAALAIYLTAAPPADNSLDFRPEDTKQYEREMEVYGGKANILASEIEDWIAGLWHGTALAGTVACISVLLALVFLLAATPLPRAADPGEANRHDSNRPNTGES